MVEVGAGSLILKADMNGGRACHMCECLQIYFLVGGIGESSLTWTGVGGRGCKPSRSCRHVRRGNDDWKMNEGWRWHSEMKRSECRICFSVLG